MTDAGNKRHRLRRAATPGGGFAVLALDHRGPLRRELAARLPAAEVERALVALKADILRALADVASAVLLDPEVGLAACADAGGLPAETGRLVALDTGSTGDPARLETALAPGWDARRIADTGAAGAKLLVYYHPEAPNAGEVERLVTRVAQDCAREELPFYLEPLVFNPADPQRPLPPGELRRAVVETARRCGRPGVDVLKLQFPVPANTGQDRAEWRAACEEITAASPVPWVLLSAGVPHDVFAEQATAACAAGAAGVMAGRAVWKEAVTLPPPARQSWLREVARPRLQQLRRLVEARPHAAPPTSREGLHEAAAGRRPPGAGLPDTGPDR